MDDPGDAWFVWSPMASLAPAFSRSNGALVIDGGGNQHEFGAWCQRVPVEPGRPYRLRVTARVRGLDDLGLHLTPHVVWRRGDLPDENCAADAIRAWHQDGELLVGEDTFAAPDNCDAAEVRLLLRYAPEGHAEFLQAALCPGELPPPRRLRVGTMKCRPEQPATAADHARVYGERIDELTAMGADLILLPEFANTAALASARGEDLREQAEPLDGGFVQMLADKARVSGCYLGAGLLERDGDFVFNTAVLLDRQGKLAGRQRKVHPYWPEEPLGVSPGDSFDVFQTDFGRLGFMICYDSWWPESARLLALRGAEIILFPNAGYEEKILPARAIDNNVFVVAASLGSPAAIIDPAGRALATSAVDGVLMAEIDLSRRPKCHPNAGGNLNPGPGGARWARNARSQRLYQDILSEVQNSNSPLASGGGDS
jgi:predicted amidohydrolase